MTEIWLRPNRRVLLVALVPLVLLGSAGVWLAIADSLVLRIIGWLGVLITLVLVIGLVHQILIPRIAYRSGKVLFHVGAGGPIAVPVQAVEAFFLGQGPTDLLATGDKSPAAMNLVARLSRRRPEWDEAPVKDTLACWSDGYVTLRGAWCEPLTGELVRRLNRRLRELNCPETVESQNKQD